MQRGALLLASVLLFTAETPESFLNLPGLAIVLTGTLAATFISYPLREVVRVIRLVGIVFRRENTYTRDDIKEMPIRIGYVYRLAVKAYRVIILSLLVCLVTSIF